jgi:hypothetical protein
MLNPIIGWLTHESSFGSRKSNFFSVYLTRWSPVGNHFELYGAAFKTLKSSRAISGKKDLTNLIDENVDNLKRFLQTGK